MESKFVNRTLIFLRIYFGVNAAGMLCWLIYFGILGSATMLGSLTERQRGDEFIAAVILGLCSIIPLVLFGFNVYAALQVKQRRKRVWILMLVLVCFGLINPYTIIPAIFLLISLLDEEVRNYYELEQENSEIKLV